MTRRRAKPPQCPIHGKPTRKSSCKQCNAAYMRHYLRTRRSSSPAFALWERARCRARKQGLRFELAEASITVPSMCPVLGIPIRVGGPRSPSSPSLDRIRPARGYVPENVRVISDRANRLKGDRTRLQLQHRARSGPPRLRPDYARVAAYVERELLLAEVRRKAKSDRTGGAEWRKVADYLERIFQRLPTDIS